MKKSYTKSLSPVLRLFLSLIPTTAPQPSSPSASPQRLAHTLHGPAIHGPAPQPQIPRLSSLSFMPYRPALSAQRSSPQPSQTQLSATKSCHAQTCHAMPRQPPLVLVLTAPPASALHKLLRSIVLRC